MLRRAEIARLEAEAERLARTRGKSRVDEIASRLKAKNDELARVERERSMRSGGGGRGVPVPLDESSPFARALKAPIPQAIAKRVKSMWSGATTETALGRINNVPVSVEDIQLLQGCEWLNDVVADCFISGLVQLSRDPAAGPSLGLRRSSFLGAYLYKFYSDGGYGAVRRWSVRHKVDVTEPDSLFLAPINLSNAHWALCAADFRTHTITYYDSMHVGVETSSTKTITSRVLSFLEEEHKDKKQGASLPGTWKTEVFRDAPQQGNGWDCGVYMCKFAEALIAGVDVRSAGITQNKMPYFRERMAAEIISKRYLIQDAL